MVNTFNLVVNFFNHPFFIILGGISTVFIVVSFIYILYLVIKGILPVWYRLGIGLSKRKIAIFAKNEYESLRNLIADSGIFSDCIQINRDNIKKAENQTVYLVYWKEFEDKIDDILAIKKDITPLIIYAPVNEGRIDDNNMNKINSHRNSIVVNFRGRLLSDILISLITTIYDKK